MCLPASKRIDQVSMTMEKVYPDPKAFAISNYTSDEDRLKLADQQLLKWKIPA